MKPLFSPLYWTGTVDQPCPKRRLKLLQALLHLAPLQQLSADLSYVTKRATATDAVFQPESVDDGMHAVRACAAIYFYKVLSSY